MNQPELQKDYAGNTSSTVPAPALDEPVEGPPPSRRTQRWELRFLIPFLIVTLVIGAVVAYYIGGWAAVAVGAVLMVVYYTLGWSAEIGAAILRRKSHED